MSDLEPLVSIIIPTYNQRPDFLRATIKSCLAQTYRNIDVVVSENHSTNDAPSVLLEFSDPRLRVIRPETHLAMVPHFEFAGNAARGELMSFLASDDLVPEDWLELIVPMLQQNKDAVFGFGEIANVHHERPEETIYFCRGNKLPTGSYSTAELLALLLPFNRASSWLVGDVMRTDAYIRAGGVAQPNILYCGDHALALRLMEQGSAVYVNKLVGLHRRWEAIDGKIDAKRALSAVDDTLELFRIVETSEKLRPSLEQMRPQLARSKRKKAVLLSLVLLQAVAMGEIGAKELKEPSDKVLELDRPLLARLILQAAKIPGVPSLVKLFHKPAKSVYRTLIAPGMNRVNARTADG